MIVLQREVNGLIQCDPHGNALRTGLPRNHREKSERNAKTNDTRTPQLEKTF
jgi:hypothetical protein